MGERWLLVLDGSTGVCSTALLRATTTDNDESTLDTSLGTQPWTVAADRHEADGRAQARVLLRLIDEMLSEVGQDSSSLDAVVVGTGPGTFTGVRITVATARALSLSLSVPVLGVSTLAALAAGGAMGFAGRNVAEKFPQMLIPVIDARRQQVFYGVYRRSEAGGAAAGVASQQRWVRTGPFEVCDRGEFAERAALEADGSQKDKAAGAAIEVVGESEALAPGLQDGMVFRQTPVRAEWLVRGQDRLAEPGTLPEGDRILPWLERTRCMGRSEIRLLQPHRVPGSPGTPESIKPVYVRSPDADLHITKMRDPWASAKTER